jgi:hypothetical protein
LQSRAQTRPSSPLFSHQMPGLVIDTTAARTPALSICSSASVGDQLV